MFLRLQYFGSEGDDLHILGYRDIALNPTQFRKAGSTDFINIRTLDETDDEVFNSIYYKEVPVVTGDLDETLIVTYLSLIHI